MSYFGSLDLRTTNSHPLLSHMRHIYVSIWFVINFFLSNFTFRSIASKWQCVAGKPNSSHTAVGSQAFLTCTFFLFLPIFLFYFHFIFIYIMIHNVIAGRSWESPTRLHAFLLLLDSVCMLPFHNNRCPTICSCLMAPNLYSFEIEIGGTNYRALGPTAGSWVHIYKYLYTYIYYA